jgi:hypothetical protein
MKKIAPLLVFILFTLGLSLFSNACQNNSSSERKLLPYPRSTPELLTHASLSESVRYGANRLLGKA